MKKFFKITALVFGLMTFSLTANAEMKKEDLQAACSSITFKTHSHFNIVNNNNVDKFSMKADFSLEFKDHVLVIHNGLNEIHISYLAIKYVSVGKPDKAHAEVKGQWYVMI